MYSSSLCAVVPPTSRCLTGQSPSQRLWCPTPTSIGCVRATFLLRIVLSGTQTLPLSAGVKSSKRRKRQSFVQMGFSKKEKKKRKKKGGGTVEGNGTGIVGLHPFAHSKYFLFIYKRQNLPHPFRCYFFLLLHSVEPPVSTKMPMPLEEIEVMIKDMQAKILAGE